MAFYNYLNYEHCTQSTHVIEESHVAHFHSLINLSKFLILIGNGSSVD